MHLNVSSRRLTTLLALALILAALLSAGSLLAASGLTRTEQALQEASLPARDRVALAQRLNGLDVIPTPPTSPARLWAVGDTAAFWVDNVDNDAHFQVEASLRYANDVVYMWVESGVEVDEEALRRSADTFANHTYPTVRATFGSEWSPGIDGDPRVYILHARDMGLSVAAYFSADSAYPPEVVASSNAHEMFYVNLDTMLPYIGTDYYDAVLAHEFQHMIHHQVDLNEDTWLNEGASELAALLAGFDDEGFAAQFLSDPQTQLNAWPDDDSHLAHYGASFLFVTYFHERFGDAATRLLISHPENGFVSVEATLNELAIVDPLSGQPLTADDLFADWTLANLLDDPTLADGRYGYTLMNDRLSTASLSAEINIFPAEGNGQRLPQYSADYLQLSQMGPGRVRFEFDGADQVRLVPVDDRDGQMVWYSNRGDSSDSTLTRAFDLRGLKAATLEYDLWYDIEHLWDYGYVMVSTDGGAHWDILSAPGSTADDPHDTAYGPGYTGSSGSNQFGPVGWLRESVDLSPYVGQEVLVRFEMITDEATNQPGMVIDDVSLPQLGYSDNFEKGPGGWESEGWVYMDNILTQRWIVQMVRRAGDTVEIVPLLGPEDGSSGAWEFDLGGPAGNVTLVISPLAPVTTEPGAYDYRISRVE